jgi:hypothetical protein
MIRKRLPPLVEPETYVPEPIAFSEALPLPGDPARTSQIFRSKRALEDVPDPVQLTYTVGYRRTSARSVVKFNEEDTLNGLANKISNYHMMKINQTYNNLLPTQARFTMATAQVQIMNSSKTSLRGKVTVHLPPMLSLGFSEAFILGGLGFAQDQIISFSLSDDPATQLFGFQNKTEEELVITSKNSFNPNLQGIVLLTTVEGAKDKFKISPADHKRTCSITVASETYSASYAKNLVVDRAFLQSFENLTTDTKALYCRSLMTTMLDDICANMSLPDKSLSAELLDENLYFRTSKKFTRLATNPYPNLTVHIEMSKRLSDVLGLSFHDFRWDCVNDLGIGRYEGVALSQEAMQSHLESPEVKKMSLKFKDSPKRIKKKLFDIAEGELMEKSEAKEVETLLNNTDPLNLDKLAEERFEAERQLDIEQRARNKAAHKKLEQEAKQKQEDIKRRRKEMIEEEQLKKAEEKRLAEEAKKMQLEQERLVNEQLLKEFEEKRKNTGGGVARSPAAKRTTPSPEAGADDDPPDVVVDDPPDVVVVDDPPDVVVDDPVDATAGGGPVDPAVVAGGGPLDPAVAAPPVAAPPVAAPPVAAPPVAAPPVAPPVDPNLDMWDVRNPAAPLPENFVCATETSLRGHSEFHPPAGKYVLPDEYFILFEEGVKSDYIEGVGPCCVMAWVKDGSPVDKKSGCEYPVCWNGVMTLSFYDNHQAIITPAIDNSLVTLNLLVNHYSK